MPVGILEAGVVAAGISAGFALGGRLRKRLEPASEESQQDVGSFVKRAVAASSQQTAAAAQFVGNSDAMTLTVLLIGESGAGKSLFCERFANAEGVGRETLPRTFAPQWSRATLVLPSLGRVTFQLLDTPGALPELSVPLYGQAQACILCFDVGSSASFAKMKAHWYSALRLHRFGAGSRHHPLSTVVLAHIIDERRERQVTRREAAAWCSQLKPPLPYYETHPAERPYPRVLAHLANTMLVPED